MPKNLYSVLSTEEEIMFICQISKQLLNDNISKGNSEQKGICLFLILGSIDIILRPIPLPIYSFHVKNKVFNSFY